jgi:sugar phosphate permease
MENFTWETQIRRLERRRWLIWVPLALAFLIVYFHRLAAGVVSDNLMREFQIEQAAELGLLSSIYFYTYAPLQIPVGIVADRISPRYTITIFLVITACGAFAFGAAPTLPWLYAARFLVGIGVAFIYITIVKVLGEWFRTREFGTLLGINGFIGNAGSIIAATPLALMIEDFGWRASFYITGFATLAIAAYCWLVVKDKPADVGLPSIAEVEKEEGAKVLTVAAAKRSIGVSIRMACLNRYTWPPLLASAGIYGVYMAFTGMWGVPYFMQIYGMSRVEAANYLVAAAVGYMLASPLVGILSDKLRSRRWPFVGYTVLLSAAWLAMTIWNGGKPPQWSLYPLCLLLGAGASSVSLLLACAREVNPPGITGVATGLANTGPFLGTALLQPLFGWLLDLKWEGAVAQGVKLYPLAAYQGAFILCAGVLTLSLLFALLIKETKCVNIARD